MDRTKDQHLTVTSLQRNIFNSFPDFDEVSDNTIWRALRSQVHFCYKKLEEIKQKTATADSIWDFWSSCFRHGIRGQICGSSLLWQVFHKLLLSLFLWLIKNRRKECSCSKDKSIFDECCRCYLSVQSLRNYEM